MGNIYDDALFDENARKAQTKEETDRKCPQCGGVMEFSPKTGKLHCPYCDYEEEIKISNDFEVKELDFNKAELDDAACDWGTATKTVTCKSCGASTVYDVNQISGVCPYCGSNQVTEVADQKIMAPGGVVRFKFTAKEAASKFTSWLKGKFFCPKKAKESAKPDAFQGVYVPYWTFDTNASASYTGEFGTERKYKDKEGKERTEVIWHPTRGHVSKFIDDQLVCGSSQQNQAIIKGIEPFDLKDVSEYKPEYMAGFTAERYSVKLKEAWEKAKAAISNILKREAERDIDNRHKTTHHRSVNITPRYQDITYKYLLVPVWISSYKYNGKVYHFMINGQTGKVSGQTPVSKLKVFLTIVVVVAVLALIFHFMNGNSGV